MLKRKSQTQKKIMSAERTKVEKLLTLYPTYEDQSLIPVMKAFIGILIWCILCIKLDNILNPELNMKQIPLHGIFIILYIIFVFYIRYLETQTTTILLKTLWGCNLSIILCGIGCINGRPFLISISIGVVCLDQLTWYFDIIFYLILNKWIIGVAKYITNPEQSLIMNLTSFHHLWFIPYCLLSLYMGNSYIKYSSFICSMLMASIATLLGRILTPKYIWMVLTPKTKKLIQYKYNESIKNGKQPKIIHIKPDNSKYLEYMNVNCGHEFFKDIKLNFFHFCNDKPWYIYIIWITFICTILSYIPFICLYSFFNTYLSYHN